MTLNQYSNSARCAILPATFSLARCLRELAFAICSSLLLCTFLASSLPADKMTSTYFAGDSRIDLHIEQGSLDASNTRNSCDGCTVLPTLSRRITAVIQSLAF